MLRFILSIFCVQAFIYGSSAQSIDNESCRENCTDFYRNCNPPAGLKRDVNETVDCDKPYYKLRCPLTCGICTKCQYQKEIVSLKERVTQLEEALKQQQNNVPPKEKELLIHHTTASSFHDNDAKHHHSNLIDKSPGTDKNDGVCFSASGSGGSSWAALHLDKNSRITRVDVLARASAEYYDYIKGAVVKVCKTDSMTHCEEFQTISTVNKGEWSILLPKNNIGLDGKVVRFEGSKPLKMCEVKVFGYEI